jgi:hypothetical protein
MNKTRALVAFESVIIVGLAALLTVYVRKASTRETQLQEARRSIVSHCDDFAIKLRLAEQKVRDSLPMLNNRDLSPAQRGRAEQLAFSSALGTNALEGDARDVLALYILSEGYFCIRSSRVTDRDRIARMDQLGRLAQSFNEARSTEAMVDAMKSINAILGGLEFDER